jgi:hypothetical protein
MTRTKIAPGNWNACAPRFGDELAGSRTCKCRRVPDVLS